jgi:GNAT superfamily N-acetyltransferase
MMNAFIKFPNILYKGNHSYVPDLDIDVRNTYNPKKNPGLRFCDAQPFVAYRDGKVVGRVAAVINHHANETWKKKVVRFSQIDFIDDDNVSRALIEAVEQWGKGRGMDIIEGPLGITDFDKEGMLLEDFDSMSAMTEYYNYPYYAGHMERMGFAKAVDWVHIRVKVPEEVPARYARVARLSKEMFGLHVRTLTKKEVLRGYGIKIFKLLNAAYAPLFGFTPMSEGQAKDYLRQYLPLLNLKLVPVVENEKGELISVAVTMTSLSHALRRTHGRLFPLGWFYLLRSLRWHPEHTAGLLLIAVRPDYQGLGVNALVFDHLIPVYKSMGIRYAETGPQLENNVKEISQWKPLNPEFLKRRRCWTKNI